MKSNYHKKIQFFFLKLVLSKNYINKLINLNHIKKGNKKNIPNRFVFLKIKSKYHPWSSA